MKAKGGRCPLKQKPGQKEAISEKRGKKEDNFEANYNQISAKFYDGPTLLSESALGLPMVTGPLSI